MPDLFRVTASEMAAFYSQCKHERSDGSGCLLWTGKVGSHGYGVFNYRGQAMLAHRFSLKVALGRDIAPGKWSLHSETCSKLCVKHVSEGTPSMNAVSAWLCGKSNQPKLNAVEVSGLKWLIASGVPVKIATKVYGVARSYLYDRKYKENCRALSF